MIEVSVFFMGISELRAALDRKAFSCRDLTGWLLERIEGLDGRFRSYLAVDSKALETAQSVDKRLADGEAPRLLEGVPVSIKDLIFTDGLPTTAGSLVFGKGLSRPDAHVIRNLRSAGAVIIGKTNLHEFAFGITTENEHFGAVDNPWRSGRIAGGSSGGSAVALATGLCYGSIGTDTRGSIRIPASCCGITGLKPTKDLISTDGVIPLSWSLDHVGPMARSVADLEPLLAAACGRPDTSDTDFDQVAELRIGLADDYFRDVEQRVAGTVEQGWEVLCHQVASSVSAGPKDLREALWASDIIARSEAVSWHDEYLKEKPECYGQKVRTRLRSGYDVSGMELARALRIQQKTTQEFQRVFESVDVLVAPTLPILPPLQGTETIKVGKVEESLVQACARLNAPQNVAGLPALSLPAGFVDGLPVGLQLIAAWRCEHHLLALGRRFQQATDWHRQRVEV